MAILQHTVFLLNKCMHTCEIMFLNKIALYSGNKCMCGISV